MADKLTYDMMNEVTEEIVKSHADEFVRDYFDVQSKSEDELDGLKEELRSGFVSFPTKYGDMELSISDGRLEFDGVSMGGSSDLKFSIQDIAEVLEEQIEDALCALEKEVEHNELPKEVLEAERDYHERYDSKPKPEKEFPFSVTEPSFEQRKEFEKALDTFSDALKNETANDLIDTELLKFYREANPENSYIPIQVDGISYDVDTRYGLISTSDNLDVAMEIPDYKMESIRRFSRDLSDKMVMAEITGDDIQSVTVKSKDELAKHASIVNGSDISH